MAIDFTSSTGMFARIGRILHISYLVTPFESALPAAFNDIFAKYLTSLEAIGGAVEIQAPQLTAAASNTMAFAQAATEQTILGMVLADQPSQARNLQAALNEVVRQMKLQSVTVEANVIAITPTVLTGSVGTGVLVTSTKRGDGLVQENSIQETLRIVCTNDAYTGGATQGQEQFSLTGSGILAGVWDYNYPTGSGANTQTNAVSADQEPATTGTLLTNGNFENWTPSTPDAPTNTLDNWTLGLGTWGTDIEQDTTNPQNGTYCLQFLPGATNTVLYQEFGDATAGTATTPAGLSSYAVNLWLRKLSGTISAGVLTVELTDGSGTVTQDAQGVSNSFTVTLSALTTSYVAYNAVFRLNATPPDTILLRFRISTDLAGASFLMDNACMSPMTGFYQGGPGFAIFSNAAVPFVGGDGWNLAVTNNQGGASYLGTFQTGFQRLLTMTQYNTVGLLLPSSTPGSLSNTLISA